MLKSKFCFNAVSTHWAKLSVSAEAEADQARLTDSANVLSAILWRIMTYGLIV
ncbi:hypothetical protein GALL_534410 [mine drainage metagenome]|uniref:Uncharacterized protein n=1 Tax=mine drainage metagenome TaxID=410659 RepID=A0A1J5PI98_9ZZZZ